MRPTSCKLDQPREFLTERCGQFRVINFANFPKKIHILHEAARVLNLYSNVCDKSDFFIKLVKSEAAGLLADHTR